MSEVWLQSNPRFWRLNVLPLAVAVLLAAAVAAVAWYGDHVRLALAATAAAGLLLLLTVASGWALARPRIARQKSELLVYARMGSPVRIPLAVVECFFLGRSAVTLPGQGQRETEVSTLVIRLAESAPEWSHGSMDRRLGRWCDSYLTLYGTWCEPLSLARVNQLNDRLRQSRESPAAPQCIPVSSHP